MITTSTMICLGVLYVILGTAMTAHVLWHGSYGEKSWWTFQVIGMFVLAFWPVVLVVRTIVHVAVSKLPARIHRIELPHGMYKKLSSAVNVFCVPAKLELCGGDWIVLQSIGKPKSHTTLRIDSVIVPLEGMGIEKEHVIVVCDKEHKY